MLLDLNEGVYFELEEVGARMWQLLSEHKRPAEVAHLVSVEYGVSEPSVSADLASCSTSCRLWDWFRFLEYRHPTSLLTNERYRRDR